MKSAKEWCDIRRSGASEYVDDRPECNCKFVEAVREEMRVELADALKAKTARSVVRANLFESAEEIQRNANWLEAQGSEMTATEPEEPKPCPGPVVNCGQIGKGGWGCRAKDCVWQSAFSDGRDHVRVPMLEGFTRDAEGFVVPDARWNRRSEK